MEKVKIKDKNNGAIIEVAKELAGDYIATGRFENIKEKKPIEKKFDINKEEK